MVDQKTTQAAEILADKVLDKVVAADTGMSKATQAETKAEVVKATEQVVMNQLNQEPWYQSRILITQYVMLIVSLAGIFGYVITPEFREEIITLVLAFGAVVAPTITIIARLWAKKPMTMFGLFGRN